MVVILASWEAANVIVQGLAAIATFCAVAVAVFSDQIQSWLLRPRVSIEIKEPGGTLIPRRNGISCRYWHLLVRNRWPIFKGRNARVWVTSLMRRGDDGEFGRQKLTMPLPLLWAHWDVAGMTRDLTDELVCDIGSIDADGHRFRFACEYWTANVNIEVAPDETVRAELHFEANAVTIQRFLIEMRWDGCWCEHDEEMAKHIAIRIVNGS